MISPDDALLHRVERTVRQHGLFLPGDTLVVALSGGADSTALLDLLARLPGFGLNLVAAHLNHCLRGVEADADQEFCRDLASRMGIPFESGRVDIRRLAQERRLNLEDAGRQARICFLDGVRGRYGAAAVVLAHHADDQAETVLMRLLRGSGMSGLAGMTYRNARGHVRPLLDVSRADIEQYLRHRDLKWCEDASNSDTSFLRNRVRHELLPLLAEYNPAIRSCLASTASLLAADEALLEQLTGRAFSQSCRAGEGRVVCDIRPFREFEPALQRRVLRHAFRELTGTLEGVSRQHIEAVCALAESVRPNARLSLPHGVAAVREYARMVLIRSDLIAAGSGRSSRITISEPGRYRLPWGGSLLVEFTGETVIPADPATACFDRARTPFPWHVRTFQPGDRIIPFGMSGRKKVKDLFIDRKVPQSVRLLTPLLFCGDELVWVAGQTVSESCRTDAPAALSVRVEWCL